MPIWVYNPHTGGKSIPPVIKARTERRILDYAAKHYSGKFTRIDVRFGISATKIVGASPGTPTPKKNISPAS